MHGSGSAWNDSGFETLAMYRYRPKNLCEAEEKKQTRGVHSVVITVFFPSYRKKKLRSACRLSARTKPPPPSAEPNSLAGLFFNVKLSYTPGKTPSSDLPYQCHFLFCKLVILCLTIKAALFPCSVLGLFLNEQISISGSMASLPPFLAITSDWLSVKTVYYKYLLVLYRMVNISVRKRYLPRYQPPPPPS